MNPIIIPDLLTLLTVSFQYPHGFARPTLKSGAVYCLTSLLTNDLSMADFKLLADHGPTAGRIILLYPDAESVLRGFPDRPGIHCQCGKSIQHHPGGELCGSSL